jgi:hypothetical protein
MINFQNSTWVKAFKPYSEKTSETLELVKSPLISFTTVTGVRVSHWQITFGSPPFSFSVILLKHFSGFHPSLNFVKQTRAVSFELLEELINYWLALN